MGAVRVLPQEVAGLRCHCIDIGAADGTSIVERAGALLSLLADSTPATVMALRGGYWWQQHFERSEARPPIEIRREGVYIVTGGLGHVGSVLAEELGRTYGVRPVLIDRTPIPPEENHADILAREGSSGPLGARLNRLRKLERAGIEFLTIAADVTSMDEMEAVASRARARFGRLDGFIHAAGASGAGAMLSIAETSRADWWRVLAPKLLGAQVLHELFEGQNLELGCFVSSLSGIAGGANYGAYAAANRFLDGFVQQHRGKRHYLAIDWEGWAGWDAPAAEKTGAKSQLVPSSWALSDDEAAAAFKLGLPFIAEGRVAVSRVPLETRIRAAAHSHVTDTVVPVQATPEEAATSYEQKLVSLWGEVLGRPVDDLHANFFDLGGDSLLAGDLAARIAESFGVWLSVTTILEVPTIAGLAARLAGTETDEEFARSSRRHRARLQAMRRNDYNDVLRPTE
jgi:NAD(P)-dependent dehydrogenase (short-subunit alcohol dehydrogenase family)/acyl carrier protein